MWETANDTFKIRISVYSEGNFFHTLDGTHYEFESAPVESNEWYKFSNAYFHDGRRSIPRQNARFVTDKIAYVFLQNWYVVTLDGGSRWIAVDIPKEFQGKVYGYLDFIRDARILPNGEGTMRIVPGSPEASNKVTELYTRDYGQHWSVNAAE
jgi:hypothetical protein